MVQMIVKMKGKKGIVTHHWGADNKGVKFFKSKIGKNLPAITQREAERYGGNKAKLISVRVVTKKPVQQQSFGFGFNQPVRKQKSSSPFGYNPWM
jgi:hypothetical protein